MRNEIGYAVAIILVRSWILIFFFPPVLTIIQSFCATAYFFKRRHDSNIKGLYVMCAVRWRSDEEYFTKMQKKPNRKHICCMATVYPFVDNIDKFNYL